MDILFKRQYSKVLLEISVLGMFAQEGLGKHTSHDAK